MGTVDILRVTAQGTVSGAMSTIEAHACEASSTWVIGSLNRCSCFLFLLLAAFRVDAAGHGRGQRQFDGFVWQDLEYIDQCLAGSIAVQAPEVLGCHGDDFTLRIGGHMLWAVTARAAPAR
ncbi:hypothetical protein [Acidovorax sp.]|uniref:hypothetical protein n=1 Tax=Acidovorax sp. TaxID=1872122 RepID=UPI00391F0BE9